MMSFLSIFSKSLNMLASSTDCANVQLTNLLKRDFTRNNIGLVCPDKLYGLFKYRMPLKTWMSFFDCGSRTCVALTKLVYFLDVMRTLWCLLRLRLKVKFTVRFWWFVRDTFRKKGRTFCESLINGFCCVTVRDTYCKQVDMQAVCDASELD